MDFVTGLPRTRKNHDSIWIVMDRLTKSSHFLVMKVSDAVDQLGMLYIKEIVRLHGISVSIVSDRDLRFIYRF